MGWGTSPRMVQGKYAVLVYDANGTIAALYQTDCREMIPILEGEARAFCGQCVREYRLPTDYYTIVCMPPKVRGTHDESL